MSWPLRVNLPTTTDRTHLNQRSAETVIHTSTGTKNKADNIAAQLVVT